MMTEQGLVPFRRSHASLVAIVAAVVTSGSLTEALANGKAHHHTSHLARGWRAERDFGHGWGWDASVGFYEGPIWGRKAKGHFRCFDPVTVGILARSMECWQRRLEGGVASGIVGCDMDV